jgi:glucan phosphoethanolaminetransferase (alkaline phosphatase superfamily)
MMARATVTQSDFETFEAIGSLGSEGLFGVTTAEDVTDYAIDVGRRSNANRLLVHYMQPHAPYIAPYVGRDENGQIDERDRRPFEALRAGADREQVWNAYVDNLRYVLSNVERLLENLDADRVVITADHGEMFGEFGLYEHIGGIPHPALKTVPWVETSASDTRSHEPEIETRTDEISVEEQLANLGYL